MNYWDSLLACAVIASLSVMLIFVILSAILFEQKTRNQLLQKQHDRQEADRSTKQILKNLSPRKAFESGYTPSGIKFKDQLYKDVLDSARAFKEFCDKNNLQEHSQIYPMDLRVYGNDVEVMITKRKPE